MKRIDKWTCLLAAALMLSACDNEEAFIPTPDADGMRQTVKIALDIDATDATATQTRAGGNGKVPEGYMLRCIVAAYDVAANGVENIKPITQFIKYLEENADLSTFKPVVELRLMAGTRYKIVGWADYVKEKGKDFYYTTGDLTRISKRDVNIELSGVDAEDAYSGVVEITTPTALTTSPIKKMAPSETIVLLTLTRPMTRIKLENAVYNSGEVTGECRLYCTLENIDGSGNTDQTYDALTGTNQTYNALTETASGNWTVSQLMNNPTGGSTFSPYAYFFMNETTPNSDPVNLTVVVESGEEYYGIKAGENGDKSNAVENGEVGKPIIIPRVVKNQKITVKDAGEGSLELYAIPSPQ